MIKEDAFLQPDFLSQVFLHELARAEENELVKILDLKNEASLSFLCDQTRIQESFCLRMERRARLIAEYLIDEKGELKVEALESLIGHIAKDGYVIYPEGLCDAPATSQTLFILKRFKEENLYRLIRKFQAPLCHTWAEDLVRATLGMFTAERLTDAHIRKAVLSACLSFLRQNVGSCFATAPAIVIQQKQTENLLTDLYEILSTGKLQRTFGGVEFSVPLSPSSGGGDLNKLILLEPLRETLCYSPGLVAAFMASGILSEKNPEKIKPFLAPFFAETEISMGDLIHRAFLSHFAITDEDLIAYEKIGISLAKTQSLTGSVSGHLSKQKWQACEKMQVAEKRARTAFKAIVEHPLVKTWEFTIASFSEVKMEFSSWNLYSSLGMHPEEKGGIGQIIYKSFEEKVQQNNEKVAEYQAEYEVAYNQLRATEALLKRASNESDARRLSAEFDTRLHHMQTCLDARDRAHDQAEKYTAFFSYLLKEYNEKFQEYFQEIYDADMRDVTPGPYEDSPAGFRLVYKHGRSNASLWTMIYTADQYIEVLVEFFLAVEPQIAADFDWDLARTVLSDITTAILMHMRGQEFLETALERMAKAHGDGGQKKPWAYTSGGTMTTLLKTYYKKEGELTEESRWVENETNLLVFLLDVLKTQPLITEDMLAKENPSLLMSSPTHAFILYPGAEKVKAGWQDNTFTYSFVRDELINPQKVFYARQKLSSSQQRFLLEELEKRVPHLQIRSAFVSEPVSIQEFRNQIAGKVRFVDWIDSFLFEMLPLTSGGEWKNALPKLLEGLDQTNLSKTLEGFPDFSHDIISAKTLKDYAKAIYMLSQDSCTFSFDLHQHVAKKAAEHGFAPQAPVLFADTNWVNNYFAFTLNPGTMQLELWRVDWTGSRGSPMSMWKQWVNGSSRKTWNVYSRFVEYR